MPRARKTGFSMLGYGAMALYASLIVAVALGVYGYNVTSMMVSQSSSDRARAAVRTGRMVITTGDRVQCRSMRFNNETAELSAETLVECDARPITREGSSDGGYFNAVRSGFLGR